MINPRAIVSYFKDCYQSDNRETSVTNFFGSKLEEQIILDSAELVQGALVNYPVDSEWAKRVAKHLQLYAKEKELACCSFFVVGHIKKGQKRELICAPLLINSVNIIYENDVYYLELSEQDNHVNPAPYPFLKLKDQGITDLGAYLRREFPQRLVGFDEVHQIEGLLDASFSNLGLSHLARYPSVWKEAELLKFIKQERDTNTFTLVPAVGVGIIRKSYLSRGVINELEEIAEKGNLSTPLLQLFSLAREKNTALKKNIHYVPVGLSRAQKNILDSIDTFTVTQVIGPPGTGKSFTIGAIAVDAISKGRSVLIAAKTDQAVDVIASKIEADFGLEGGIGVIRGGRKGYKKELKDRLENILNGIGLYQTALKTINNLKGQIASTLIEIRKLEKALQSREENEIRWGRFLAGGPKGLFYNWRRRFLEKRVKNVLPYWELVEAIESMIAVKERLVREYVVHKYDYELEVALVRKRSVFRNFLAGLRARTGTKRERSFAGINYQYLFKAFPIWLVKAADINDILPLERGLFDIVVIDEATQCDIASAIPLLHRAKKAAIVGDPKQLRHVSFLSHHRQKQLINLHGLSQMPYEELDYRSNSILDLASAAIDNQNQVHFLDEHYRSKANIIRFSNREFYNGALKIMTHHPNEGSPGNVQLHLCPGKKHQAGYNKVEAETAIEIIQGLARKEEMLEDNYCQSIGVLSPFREQVNHLRKKIDGALSYHQMERHKILIGTPYEFQGEERDVMILSFTIDPDTHPSAIQYLNKEDVLNVSVTRARAEQHVLISTDPQNLNSGKLFHRFLHSIENTTVQKLRHGPVVDDEFAEAARNHLKGMGVDTIFENYLLLGFNIDLLVFHQGKMLGIDLVGFPGIYEKSFAIERYRMLNRAGIRILPLPYSLWVLDLGAVMKKLERELTN